MDGFTERRKRMASRLQRLAETVLEFVKVIEREQLSGHVSPTYEVRRLLLARDLSDILTGLRGIMENEGKVLGGEIRSLVSDALVVEAARS